MNKPSIYSVLRMRQIIKSASVLIVALVLGLAITSNMLSQSKKAEAAIMCSGNDITISINSDYIFHAASNSIICPTGGTILEKDANLTLTLINSGTFIIYGTHTFNNLTIDKATVTHADLLPGVDYDSNSFAIKECGTSDCGSNKKVDIVVNGKLTIKNSGSVNASGKGFRGAAYDKSTGWEPSCAAGSFDGDGDGLGGGGKSVVDTDQVGGGGGGFGGVGGYGYYSDSSTKRGIGGIANGLASDKMLFESPLEYGSGGGMACESGWLALGGNGGGVIRIEASQLAIEASSSAKITADGSHGEWGIGADKVKSWDGGGGSGGDIRLKIKSSYSDLRWSDIGSTLPSAQKGNLDLVTDYSVIEQNNIRQQATSGFVKISGDYPKNYFSDSTKSPSISANGGDAYEVGGPGGGGKILLILPPSSNGVRKSLEAVDRGGSASFNPYALQKGDKIKVTLKVGANGSSYDLTDIYLKATGVPATYCKCTTASDCNASPPASSITGDSIIWNGANSPTLSYECKVQ